MGMCTFRLTEVVLAAVMQCWDALRYASDNFQANKDVVLAAVTHYGDTLKYSSEDLQAVKKVVLASRDAKWKCVGECIGGPSSTSLPLLLIQTNCRDFV